MTARPMGPSGVHQMVSAGLDAATVHLAPCSGEPMMIAGGQVVEHPPPTDEVVPCSGSQPLQGEEPKTS